jgi:hypothetical protein
MCIKKPCFAMAQMILMFVLTAPSNGSVSKQDLQSRVQKESEDALMQELKQAEKSGEIEVLVTAASPALTGGKEDIKKRITLRAAAFAKTIDKIPMSQINDDLAQWIEQSLVMEVRSLGLTFIKKPSFGESYRTAAEKRFSTMDNAKGQQLLKQRDVFLKSAKDYQDALKNYTIQKLSQVKTFKLIFVENSAKGVGTFTQSLKSVRNLDDHRAEPITNKSSVNDRNFDFRNELIDSKIVNLALIRATKQLLDSYAVVDWFSFASVVSPAYEEGDPRGALKMKTFAQVTPQIDNLYNNCVTEGEGSTQLDALCFENFLWEVTLLRYRDAQLLKKETTVGKPYVIFLNDSSLWKLLMADDNALSKVR